MRRLTGTIALCLALAGCEEFDLATRSEPRSPATKVNLTASKVQVEGPYGFCVEPKSIKAQSTRASVLFANCAAITGSNDAPQSFSEAIVAVTATRLSAEAANAFRDTKALEDYLLSSIGRASLSRSGKADSVEILASQTTRRAVYLRMRDTSDGNSDTLTPSYWRSVFAMPQAAVSISVRGLEGGTLSSREALSLAREFTANTRSALGEDG